MLIFVTSLTALLSHTRNTSLHQQFIQKKIASIQITAFP